MEFTNLIVRQVWARGCAPILLITTFYLTVCRANGETPEYSLLADPGLLRKQAVSCSLPSYPPFQNMAGEDGLVIVRVSVNPQGGVDKLTLVEGYHEAAWQSVHLALSNWRFVELKKNAMRVGNLFFAFRSRRGAGIVTDLVAAAMERRSENFPCKNQLRRLSK